MLKARTGENTALSAVFDVLPYKLVSELKAIMASRRKFAESICEIRIRCDGPSTVVLSGESLPLITRLDREDFDGVIARATEGSMYAFRDTVEDGYIAMPHGVRVGVVGEAKYDGGKMRVSEISYMVFRIPSGKCEFAEELCELWQTVGGNMLIASKPSGGKTTALRGIARVLGGGRYGKRVVVVDRRCEFRREDYSSSTVDLLFGYERSTGIEIAIRTMSPDVIIIDELTTDADSRAVYSALGAGVCVIASAHAESEEDVRQRACLEPLMSNGFFSSVTFLRKKDGVFGFDFVRLRGK